jgi:hypothetical protein
MAVKFEASWEWQGITAASSKDSPA